MNARERKPESVYTLGKHLSYAYRGFFFFKCSIFVLFPSLVSIGISLRELLQHASRLASNCADCFYCFVEICWGYFRSGFSPFEVACNVFCLCTVSQTSLKIVRILWCPHDKLVRLRVVVNLLHNIICSTRQKLLQFPLNIIHRAPFVFWRSLKVKHDKRVVN